ncbi:MAG: hypothetical protein M3416_21340 [Acidobacteriota bacterium]|nr:hypothetical protein [Acidobacteriota bacterium]
MSTEIQESVSEDFYFRTDDPDLLARMIDRRKAVLGCYRRLHRQGGSVPGSRLDVRIREMAPAIELAEAKLAALRGEEGGLPAAGVPFRGRFVEVRRARLTERNHLGRRRRCSHYS